MTMLVDQPTNAPTRKVAVGAMGGVIGGGGTAVVLWLWNMYNPESPMPMEVAAVVAAAGAWAVQTITSYLVRERA